MNTSFNTKHFTYHTGTSSELNASKTICYFVKDQVSLSTDITVSNLPEYYTELKEKYMSGLPQGVAWSTRTVSEPIDYFVLNPTSPDQETIVFDTIIYISSSGKPVGYTYFSEHQENIRDGSRMGEMRLSFYFHIKNDLVDFNVSFTLEPIWSTLNPLLTESFVTTRQEILDRFGELVPGKNDYLRYTDSILQLTSGMDNFSCVTDTGVLTRKESFKYWIPKVPLEDIVKYTHYNVGYTGGRLVLYRWTDIGDYTIDLLTEYNHFGILKNLRKGRIYLKDTESIEVLVDNMMILNTGKYQRSGYVDLKTGHRFSDITKRLVNDPWDESDNVSLISSSQTSSSLEFRFLSVPPGKYYYFLEKYGPWYVFLNEKTGTKAWCSLYGTAYFKGTDTVLPFSDRILLRVSPDHLEYYLFNGNSDYPENSVPTYQVDLVYSNPVDTDYTARTPTELIDSIRHRPLPSMDLSFLKSSPLSIRGIVFYLDQDKNICTL